jgi:phosphoribosylaminoimidazole-succinocarboxamide synthase
MPEVLLDSDLPNLTHRGKVRDIYDLGEQLLIVATDRISALDAVLPTGIPRKGEVLTRLSAWWFERIAGVVPNHFVALITADTAHLLPFDIDARYHGRSMLVRKAKRIDAECIARGYLSGSAWKEYQASGRVGGQPLAEGMLESQKLPETMFTPTTKAEVGHDESMTYEELIELVGPEEANAMRIRTIATYDYGHEVALACGLIIADTKFEFGIWNEEVILIDEALTPDSSRFWPLDGYRPGGPQPSFDKQPVRDWLAANWREGDPPPALPDDVVAATTERYLTAYRMLTGTELE